MATRQQIQDKLDRAKAEEQSNNPKNNLRPAAIYKALGKDKTPAYESARLRANMAEQELEAMDRAPNSREQYLHEKEQGDPSANRLSFEDWKKL